MYWIIHNGVTLDVIPSHEAAVTFAAEVAVRHPHSSVTVRFLK